MNDFGMTVSKAQNLPHAGRDGNIAGLLLAGGQARRMGGGDKCLLDLGGQTVLAQLAVRFYPRLARIALNANGDPSRFCDYIPTDLPILPDVVGGFAGPLAGILTGLEWARNQELDWIVTLPTDAPFLPENLVVDLAAGLKAQQAELAVAVSGGRTHPVIGLWPVSVAPDLRQALVEHDIRKIDKWTCNYNLAQVVFPHDPPNRDPFFNLNRPEDLVQARSLLS